MTDLLEQDDEPQDHSTYGAAKRSAVNRSFGVQPAAASELRVSTSGYSATAQDPGLMSLLHSAFLSSDGQSTSEQTSQPFLDTTGQTAPHGIKPTVSATLWDEEAAFCVQVEVNGICVARRTDNDMVNGTKLFNVAGMTRGRRDGLLKAEKVRHVVSAGPMHLKGVWITLDRALEFANREKITNLLYPLFLKDIGTLLYHSSNAAHQSIGKAAIPELSSKQISSQVSLRRPPFPVPPDRPFAAPNIDRAQYFPTPPTSAPSLIGSGESTTSYEYRDATTDQSYQPLSVDVKKANMPTTPSSTPPPDSQNVAEPDPTLMADIGSMFEGQLAETSTADNALKAKRPYQRIRTKTGCLTCRARKKKCGEEHPVCQNCVKGRFKCEGYNQRRVEQSHLQDAHPLSTTFLHQTVLEDLTSHSDIQATNERVSPHGQIRTQLSGLAMEGHAADQNFASLVPNWRNKQNWPVAPLYPPVPRLLRDPDDAASITDMTDGTEAGTCNLHSITHCQRCKLWDQEKPDDSLHPGGPDYPLPFAMNALAKDSSFQSEIRVHARNHVIPLSRSRSEGSVRSSDSPRSPLQGPRESPTLDPELSWQSTQTRAKLNVTAVEDCEENNEVTRSNPVGSNLSPAPSQTTTVDSSSESPHQENEEFQPMLVGLRTIIQDLGRRADRLLFQTRPNACSSLHDDSRGINAQRSQSTPPHVSSDSPGSTFRSDSLSELRPVQDLSMCRSQSVDSRLEASRFSRVGFEENSISQQACIHDAGLRRSRSLPPSERYFNTARSAPVFWAGAKDGTGSNQNYAEHREQNLGQGSSRKRQRSNGLDDNRDDPPDPNENDPAGKRQRIGIRDDDASERKRFRCIFHVGEPALYPRDKVRYEHISQLLRHLKSHDFYACSRCFTKFSDMASQEAHERNPCGKSCSRRRCRRYAVPESITMSHCRCVDSSEDQWKELYRLQYPDIPPAELWESDPGMDRDHMLGEDLGEFRSADSGTAGSSESSSQEQNNTIEGLLQDALNVEGFPMQQTSAMPMIVDNAFLMDIHALRQRIQILEQRTSQPTDREQDLEMVLANVWQALVRSRSKEGQPESAVWRLVRRFASNVLSTSTPAANDFTASNNIQPTTSTEALIPDWDSLLDPCELFQTSSKLADSGYGTGS